MLTSERNYTAAELQERHSAALNYAAEKIIQWEYASEIRAVYLYGSFARGEHSYDSDVDVYVVCARKLPHKALCELRTAVMPDEDNLPDVQISFGFRPLDEEKDFFHENVKKDGILLWKEK